MPNEATRIKGHPTGERVADEGMVELKTVRLPDGSEEFLELHQIDGRWDF
jgi:hypothetical protein